ncbi:hypothetical protein GQ600_21973 [Phytophthora cactorum]|nr:hypothetical protein GQ600_21973 [Phytophthora cactorum]
MDPLKRPTAAEAVRILQIALMQDHVLNTTQELHGLFIAGVEFSQQFFRGTCQLLGRTRVVNGLDRVEPTSERYSAMKSGVDFILGAARAN